MTVGEPILPGSIKVMNYNGKKTTLAHLLSNHEKRVHVDGSIQAMSIMNGELRLETINVRRSVWRQQIGPPQSLENPF